MPPKKRSSSAINGIDEPIAKRRSSRQAAAAKATASEPSPPAKAPAQKSEKKAASKLKAAPAAAATKKESSPAPLASAKEKTAGSGNSSRAVSEDPHPDSIPRENPEAVHHEGKWYWLMKAEPESRFENGIDVRFSIDDLRACTKPEGWDGNTYSFPSRNNLRAMNAGDMAFFYHSNCKTPGIVGTMEIVREYSEDKSARRPGTPYYDAASTKDKPRWSLVHVEFRRKFAVPILLPELRELGKAGGPLEEMQMLRQSRLSVSKVSETEWNALCALADEKAHEAGLKHEDA
ncbi:Pfam:DUF55 [Geosmithia morbida]|uniref:Thymocyte nuclear protein 1 n=1 Tax=Geosmithia morbida TaxID=1094350 RepID=A0A9P4YZV6_9HYPO|nr:Pfam:DUF55 [Geosmithia morbida]KAF4124826.1 Pfam:DUF55 [Geosmithia morbida]